MHLSASVLAAALLSSALTIGSSARDAPREISAMALGPDVSPHVPYIRLSKRGGSLTPRYPQNESTTDGVNQDQLKGNGSDPNSSHPNGNGTNPDTSQSGGGSEPLTDAAGHQNNPNGNTQGAAGHKGGDSKLLNQGGNPIQNKTGEQGQQTTSMAVKSEPTLRLPSRPDASKQEGIQSQSEEGSNQTVGSPPAPSLSSVQDSHSLEFRGSFGDHNPDEEKPSGIMTKTALTATTEGSSTEMTNPLQKTEPTLSQDVQQGQTKTGSSASGIAESTIALSSAPTVLAQQAAIPGPIAPGQRTSLAADLEPLSIQNRHGQPEKHDQQLDVVGQDVKATAAQRSQGSSLVGAHGSHQTEPSPGQNIAGDPATHQNNVPVKNGTGTPEETEPNADSVQAVTSGSGTDKKTDGKAGGKVGEDESAAPGVPSGPNTLSTPTLPSASGNGSVTGLEPVKPLKPVAPSALDTPSASSNGSETGTSSGPGSNSKTGEDLEPGKPLPSGVPSTTGAPSAPGMSSAPGNNSTGVSAGTAKLSNATCLTEPLFPVSTPVKPIRDKSTAAGTSTTGSAKPTHAVQPIVTPISVSALVSAKASVTFPKSLVIVDGAAYFPGLVEGSGYFRVVVDVAASLVFRIERCQQDERNTVVVKAKGEYRYLECSGAECNAVVRVDVCGTVRVAPCAGQCDASVFCERAGQCVDAGHRPAVPRAPVAPGSAAAASSTIKVTTNVKTNISVSALAQVVVTPKGGVTGLIRAVAEVQASQGRGTVSILAKAIPASPGVPALPASPASGSKPAPSAGAEEAPASASGTKPSSDSDKGPIAHDKPAASSHEQAPGSAAKGGVSPEPGSGTAPAGAPAQPNSAAADDTASRPDHASNSPYQAPAAPVKATTGPASPSNGGVSPSKPQDQRPVNALTAAASRHMVGAHLIEALAVLVLMA